MSFSPDGLRATLRPQGGRDWCLAFSGGLDSTVLLHALAGLVEGFGANLRAVHIDHGWHPDSASWAAHCVRAARRLGVDCTVARVDIDPDDAEGPEAAARRARRAAIAAALGPGEVLFTAQHADDQAESVLLALLRGSGPDGLAAMPREATLGANALLRPLLDFTRDELEAWARAQGFDWLEDPSNRDARYARGFLRERVMPVLRERWPGLAGSFSRSAELAAEASVLLDALALQDLGGEGDGPLPVALLEHLPPERARNLLRAWLRRAGLPTPPYPRLAEALRQMLDAGADRNPVVEWPGGVVRRFQGRVYAHAPLEPVPHDWSAAWDGAAPLALPSDLGTLAWVEAESGLDADRLAAAGLEVRFRAGGERIRPAGQAHHVQLKHLLQRAGVPPWERGRIPLLFADGELIAVGDLWIAHEWSSSGSGSALKFVWTRGEPRQSPA